jgi:hypothetical protein
MRSFQASGLAAGMMLLALATGRAQAQIAETWVPLGCQKVGFQVDRDVLRVGKQDGRFRALRLRAQDHNIFMLDLKVVYGNGAPDDIQVRAEVRAGGTSGRLDLRGQDRAIARVEMVYRTQPNSRGRGTVCVDGLAVVAAVAPPPASTAQWVRLGCQRVGFRVDRDVIRVGTVPGGFRAIRLRAAGNEIFVFDVKVVYGNGAPDDLPVKALIRAGGTSGRLDLKGERRQINRVELIYRSRPDFRGQAEVCVDGSV